MSGSSTRDVPSSWRLFERARRGDSSALGQLLGRYLPELRRWAHGLLPRSTRAAIDTADVIQDAVLRTLFRLDTFEPRRRRALAAYLHRAVRNRIRDEHRRVARRGVPEALSEALCDPEPSPLERAIAHETESRYRAALTRMRAVDRDVIVAHVELGYSHEQLACMIGRSPNAARMALQRAVRRLAQQMAER